VVRKLPWPGPGALALNGPWAPKLLSFSAIRHVPVPIRVIVVCLRSLEKNVKAVGYSSMRNRRKDWGLPNGPIVTSG
jgi:hypothetical protein